MMVVVSLSTTTRLARPSCVELHVLELEAELLGDELAAGQHRHVCEHRLAAVAEARRLDRDALQHAADLVDDQRGERLALDVLGDDQDRPARLRHLLEQRDQVLEQVHLAVGEQHVRVLEHRLHLLRVGDEVGRDVAAVELHALDDFEHRLGGLRFLDRDDAFAADLLHGVGDQLADRRVVVRRDGRDLRLLLARAHRARHVLERRDRRRQPAVEAALEVDGARAGRDVAHAVGEDRVGEDGRRAGAVADHVAGLLRRLAQHLRAEVLLRVLEVEFLGDGHAVVADDRRAPLLLDQHRLRLRAERDAHGLGELGGAAQDLLARRRAEQDLLVRHGEPPAAAADGSIVGLRGGARGIRRSGSQARKN